MAQSNLNSVNDENVIRKYKNKNYMMNIKRENIKGYIDDFDAMPQVIYKILNTQRYKYRIYSWNYGIELEDLLGKDARYVCNEVEVRVKDALLQDDRITQVHTFSFDISKKGSVFAEFIVETIFGEVPSNITIN